MKIAFWRRRPHARAARRGYPFVWLLFGPFLLLVAGCDDDDPTAPEEENIFVFESQLTQQESVVHEVVFSKDGTLRFTLEELRPVLLDTTDIAPESLAIQFELARRREGVCGSSTARLNFVEDQVFLIDISSTDYCFTISDPGFLPDGSTIAYRMVVELE